METIELLTSTFKILKSMSIACSKDNTTRHVLQFIYYHKELNQFVATDGHILRVEKNGEYDYQNNFTEFDVYEEDFLIHYEEFEKYSAKAIKNSTTLKVDVNKSTYNKDLEFAPTDYPKYLNVIPETNKSIENIALNLDIIQQFNNTIIHTDKSVPVLTFEFTGEMKAIKVYKQFYNDSGEIVSIFKGVIVPARISKD